MNYYNDNKVTYQQLVMDQIKKIQDICSKELRDGDKILKNAMGEQTIEGEDTRYSFLQSVELLGSMLKPWFGNMMKVKDSEKGAFEMFCDYYDVELIEILDDEDFKKKLKDLFGCDDPEKLKTDEALRQQVNLFLLNDKIKEARKIFRLLVKVFKANDFLSGQSYGEGTGDIDSGNDAVIDEDDDGVIDDEDGVEAS
jgi:hypothetical protein